MVRINEDTCEKHRRATCVFHSSFDKMMPSGLGLLDMICANMLIIRHAALVFIAQGAATEKHYWEYIQWFWLDPLKVMLFLFWPLSLKSLPQILQLYGGVIPNCFCVPRPKLRLYFPLSAIWCECTVGGMELSNLPNAVMHFVALCDDWKPWWGGCWWQWEEWSACKSDVCVGMLTAWLPGCSHGMGSLCYHGYRAVCCMSVKSNGQAVAVGCSV